MTKAIATCICKTCGAEFKTERKCANRTDADNWTEWAENNIVECPKCYKIRISLDNEKKASKFELPEITTGSEKQIKFANDLRNKFFLKREDYVKKFDTCIEMLHNPEALKKLADAGVTPEQGFQNVLNADDNFRKIYELRNTTDAKTVINMLYQG